MFFVPGIDTKLIQFQLVANIQSELHGHKRLPRTIKVGAGWQRKSRMITQLNNRHCIMTFFVPILYVQSTFHVRQCIWHAFILSS